MYSYRFYFAQAYGNGTYSECTYNNTSSCTSTNSSGGSSQLTNTGFDIFVLATLACFLIFVALAARMWRKKRSHGTAETKQGSNQQNPPEDS